MAAKFLEFVYLWNDSYSRHLNHRDECAVIAKRIRERIIKEWEWPEDRLAFYRKGKNPWDEPTEVKVAREAMLAVDEEDGGFFFGFRVHGADECSDKAQ